MNPEMEELKLLLARASAEPIGLICRSDDPARARQKMYLARKASYDPDLANLQIRLVQIGEGNIVICKNKVLAPAQSLIPASPPAKSSSPPVQQSDKSAEELDL